MKKNLHFVLALTLGLATTVSAQDWSVDSRTRVNSTDDAMSTEQRVRTAVDFGGEAVSAHVELNSAATLGAVANQDFSLTVREAYATTNVMDYASLTAGRMALNFGSGRILGDNDFVQGNGNTWDGFLVGINAIESADIHVGYASTNMTSNTVELFNATTMYANAAGEFSGLGVNLLYVNSTEDVSGLENTSLGLDAAYSTNGVDLTMGYYTNEVSATGVNAVEMDLITLGASYGVNDALTIHAGYDMYGENGFYLGSGSFGTMYGSGMDYSSFTYEGTDLSFGGSYAMGDFMVGATMHQIASEDEAIDYAVTDLSLGYTLSDNSSIKVNYATSDMDANAEYTKTWISLHVGF
tara:strand:- start:1206 stop:2264 length:1059 start_codon:yes stop_codon:yes gene_type:complete